MSEAYSCEARERTQPFSHRLCRPAGPLDNEDKPQDNAALLNKILSWSGLGR